MTTTEIITDEQMKEAFANADFGKTPHRQVLARSVLKCACGYPTGSFARAICAELGLTTSQWELTPLGRQYLYAAYSKFNQ